MGLDLNKFGPQLPTGNSSNVLSKLQNTGLPNPSSPNLQSQLLANNLAGPNAKTVFNSNDVSQLMAARSAPQFSDAAALDVIKTTADLVNFLNDAGPSTGFSSGSGTSSFNSSGGSNLGLGGTANFGPAGTVRDNITTHGDFVSKYGDPYQANSTSTVRKQDSIQKVKSGSYTKVRIPWELTTTRRLALGIESIRFYANPSQVKFALQLTQSLDQVQRGWFMTVWQDYEGKPNFFSMLRLNFTFQSSNILPETYSSGSSISSWTSKADLQAQQQSNTSGTTGFGDSSNYDGEIPPGLRNFYDIMEIINEPRIIDISDESMRAGTNLDTVSEQLTAYNGEPNYVLLKISTRIFPEMWCMGFIENGLDWSESAMNPLEFELPMSFVAFKTEPAWWDVDKIKSKYAEFWTNYFVGDQTPDSGESVPKTPSSNIDQETLDAADASGGLIPPSGTSPESGDEEAEESDPDAKAEDEEPQPPAEDDKVKKEQADKLKADIDSHREAEDQVIAKQANLQKANMDLQNQQISAMTQNPVDQAKVDALQAKIDANNEEIAKCQDEINNHNTAIASDVEQLNNLGEDGTGYAKSRGWSNNNGVISTEGMVTGITTEPPQTTTPPPPTTTGSDTTTTDTTTTDTTTATTTASTTTETTTTMTTLPGTPAWVTADPGPNAVVVSVEKNPFGDTGAQRATARTEGISLLAQKLGTNEFGAGITQTYTDANGTLYALVAATGVVTTTQATTPTTTTASVTTTLVSDTTTATTATATTTPIITTIVTTLDTTTTDTTTTDTTTTDTTTTVPTATSVTGQYVPNGSGTGFVDLGPNAGSLTARQLYNMYPEIFNDAPAGQPNFVTLAKAQQRYTTDYQAMGGQTTATTSALTTTTSALTTTTLTTTVTQTTTATTTVSTKLDAAGNPFLPAGQYPPSAYLLQWYGNPLDDLSLARATYNAARNS
jgi:hypothetical protein